MKSIRITLAFIAFMPLSYGSAESKVSAPQQAREMIARFEDGKLRPGYDAGGVRADISTSGMPIIGSRALVMIVLTNVKENASVVVQNGKDLAALGYEVFPHAFALLDHEHAYMRIIGAAALNTVSGLECNWSNSGISPWEANGIQTEWALKAKKTWLEWYAAKLETELTER